MEPIQWKSPCSACVFRQVLPVRWVYWQASCEYKKVIVESPMIFPAGFGFGSCVSLKELEKSVTRQSLWSESPKIFTWHARFTSPLHLFHIVFCARTFRKRLERRRPSPHQKVSVHHIKMDQSDWSRQQQFGTFLLARVRTPQTCISTATMHHDV